MNRLIVFLVLSLVISCEEENIPPECSISSPEDGAVFVVGDTVEIEVSVWDENQHATLVFYSINGVEMEVDDWVDCTSTYNWDTEGFGFGEYDIGIGATDFHGGVCCDRITVILKKETVVR